MSAILQKPEAILFDLDGTLIDSAADLGNAANAMLEQRQRPILAIDQYRPYIGSGARGILSIAFPEEPLDSEEFRKLCNEFYDLYETDMGTHTKVFSGVEKLLSLLQANNIAWGIVTNKSERFSIPLIASIAELKNTPVLICGDTTAHAKPHPLPLLEAAKRLGVSPPNSMYVGDDKRDMLAGKSANMTTIAALYGFIAKSEDINEWPADHRITQPLDLLDLLTLA